MKIARSSGHGPDSGHKFFQVKGFYQIIIGACIQAVYTVMKTAQGGGEYDRSFDICASQGFENREAVDLRQHAVQNNRVIDLIFCVEEAVISGIAGVRVVAGLM